MFELYQTNLGSRGSLAEVWIDKDARLVKKYYKPTGITIRGGHPYHQDIDEISRLFDSEIYWSTKLKGKQVLQTYEHGPLRDEPGFYILQEYVGPDLLHYYDGEKLSSDIKNPAEQIVELFALFKDKNMYKINNAMCNLTNDNGIIRAFDFKYAKHRSPEYLEHEIYSIETWISKIDRRLPKMLEIYL